MKTKLLIFVHFVVSGILFTSCDIVGGGSDSKGTDPIGGELSPMGAVGNTFTATFPGTSEKTFQIVAREGDVSTVEVTATVTNPFFLNILQSVDSPTVKLNGNQVTIREKLRITSKGIQNVTYDGKTISLAEYDARVGDTYKTKAALGTFERKVTRVSSDDDYPWGFMMIKTIKVEETIRHIPGISKVVYYANHRFGLVGMDVIYEDGSQTLMNIYSEN